MDLRYRGMVLSDLADWLCHCILDCLCAQERQAGWHSNYAYLFASATPDHRNGCWQSLVYVPVTNKSTLLEKQAKATAFACFYSAFRICVRIVAPEPPMFCAMPTFAPSTCVLPHSPRNCWTTSTI